MEEIERSVSPLVDLLLGTLNQLLAATLAAISIPQAVAIGLSLFLAVLFHRWVRALILRLETQISTPIFRRLFRTAQSISLAIAWLLGLWISLIALGGFGQVTGLVRLVASLLNAWVVIRVTATLIPNHTLSNT
jgi:hypothetical protein